MFCHESPAPRSPAPSKPRKVKTPVVFVAPASADKSGDKDQGKLRDGMVIFCYQ